MSVSDKAGTAIHNKFIGNDDDCDCDDFFKTEFFTHLGSSTLQIIQHHCSFDLVKTLKVMMSETMINGDGKDKGSYSNDMGLLCLIVFSVTDR